MKVPRCLGREPFTTPPYYPGDSALSLMTLGFGEQLALVPDLFPEYASRMNWRKTAIVASTLALLPAWPMHALCIYRGQLYAKTTLSQEFYDSKWIVRAKVTAADDHWSDVGESWTIYHLRVLSSFKGGPPTNIRLFTYRDSGGFYLNKGMNADLGGEYLLFLDPISREVKFPTGARGATEVNYNCGQSRAWASVSDADQKQLVGLARSDH